MTEANISWVTDQIATGGDLSFDIEKGARQFIELLDMDLDLIIDCRAEATDKGLWESTAVTYLHLPTDDKYGWKIPPEHFDRAVEEAMPVLEGGGKVFVHCHMGVNRGPSTAYALLLEQGMSSTRAFDLIRKARPQAAIVYAEDALEAHLRRQKASMARVKARLGVLRDHINRVMTPRERAKINHIIRQGHENDSNDIKRMASLSGRQ